jgi:hypothetical protein
MEPKQEVAYLTSELLPRGYWTVSVSLVVCDGAGHTPQRQRVIAGSRLLIYVDGHSVVHRTAAQTDLRRGQRAGGIGRHSTARERRAAGET